MQAIRVTFQPSVYIPTQPFAMKWGWIEIDWSATIQKGQDVLQSNPGESNVNYTVLEYNMGCSSKLDEVLYSIIGWYLPYIVIEVVA